MTASDARSHAPDVVQTEAEAADRAPALPPVAEQAETLVRLGLHDHLALPAEAMLQRADDLAARAGAAADGALLVVHPRQVAVSRVAPLMRVGDKDGFVVEDMTDLDAFTDTPSAPTPDSDLYLVLDPRRGEEWRGSSPQEYQQHIDTSPRTPLTVAEGVHWVLQSPGVLVKNHCFMTIGSRLPRTRPGTYDARTPALWISGGTGRDGAARRGAAKVGWCWWRNRHDWLGFASASGRLG